MNKGKTRFPIYDRSVLLEITTIKDEIVTRNIVQRWPAEKNSYEIGAGPIEPGQPNHFCKTIPWNLKFDTVRWFVQLRVADTERPMSSQYSRTWQGTVKIKQL